MPLDLSILQSLKDLKNTDKMQTISTNHLI